MEVRNSARKHGVPDADMFHALRNYLHVEGEDGLVIYIGPARNGELLEVGVSTITGDLIHAMKARPKYLIYMR